MPTDQSIAYVPRYYAKGYFKEGDQVLSDLHALPIEHERVQRQKQEILDSIELEKTHDAHFKLITLLWDNTELRSGRRIRIGGMILAMQQ